MRRIKGNRPLEIRSERLSRSTLPPGPELPRLRGIGSAGSVDLIWPSAWSPGQAAPDAWSWPAAAGQYGETLSLSAGSLGDHHRRGHGPSVVTYDHGGPLRAGDHHILGRDRRHRATAGHLPP